MARCDWLVKELSKITRYDWMTDFDLNLVKHEFYFEDKS